MDKKGRIFMIKWTVTAMLIIAAVAYSLAVWKSSVRQGSVLADQVQAEIEHERENPHEGIIRGLLDAATKALTQGIINGFNAALKPRETPQQQKEAEPQEQEPADYYSDTQKPQQKGGE